MTRINRRRYVRILGAAILGATFSNFLFPLDVDACSPPPSYPAANIFVEQNTVEGSYTRAPNYTTYSVGTSVTLNATGNDYGDYDYVFDYWMNLPATDFPSGPAGAGTSSSNPVTMTVRGPDGVKARYKKRYKLTVTTVGQGTVAPGTGKYFSNTAVSLTATPSAGWTFDHWEGDLTGSANPASVTMNAKKTVTAVFMPTVSFAVQTSSVGEATTPATISVNLSAAVPTGGPTVSVNYAVTGGTATGGGTDYTLAAGTLTFTDGQANKSISVAINNDALDETNETVEITLSSPTSAILGATTVHTLTITDDDPSPTVQFQSAASSADEGAGTVSIPVTLNTASGRSVTVDYTVSGTATGGGTDHSLANGQLTFTASQTSNNIPVMLNNDTLNEHGETVIVTLSSPTNATLGTPSTHILTITDNDPLPAVKYASPGTTVTEGTTTTLNVAVSLDAPSGRSVTVPFDIGSSHTATGSDDYTIAAAPVTINAGQTSANIVITIVDDTLSESTPEYFVVNLYGPTNATLGSPNQHVVTIVDNDPMPTVQFQAATSTANESAGTVDVPVTLSTASGASVTVNYTVSGTATGGGTDYTLANGQLTFAAGQVSENISVVFDNDAIDENDETVVITLGSPSNATLGTPSTHTLTITDNDDPPTVQFQSASSSANEGAGTVSVPVSLNTESGRSLTVSYAVTGGTATGGGTDFTLAVGTLTFDAGQTIKSIPVPIVNDALAEAIETIVISLNAPTNSTLGSPASHVLSIGDDDSALLTTAVIGEGAISPSGGTYLIGSTIPIEARPSPDWRFDHWEGALSGEENPTSIVMSSDKSVTAVFVETYTVTTTQFGGGMVASDPPGFQFDPGETVTFTSVASNGWEFQKWEGDFSGSQNPLVVNMTGPRYKKLFARFVRQNYAVTINTIGTGFVTKDIQGQTAPFATQVSLQATPGTGWQFDHWEGDIEEPAYANDNPTTVTIDSSKSIAATFVEMPTLSVQASNGGSFELDPPGGRYPVGTRVRLSAQPDSGFTVREWIGDAISDDTDPNRAEVVMESDKSVSISFAESHELTVHVSPSTVDSLDPDRSYLKISPVQFVDEAPKTLGLLKAKPAVDESVALHAEPYPAGAYVFKHWEKDSVVLSQKPDVIIPMDEDQEVTAVYIIPQVVLEVDQLGEGGVWFDGSPEDVYSGEKAVRPIAAAGTPVTVYPVAASGWAFDHWILPDGWDSETGEAQKAANDGLTLANAQSASIAAVFVPKMDGYVSPADTNSDGIIDQTDLDFVISVKENGPFDPRADMNQDCEVNQHDVKFVRKSIVGHASPRPQSLSTYVVGQGAVTYLPLGLAATGSPAPGYTLNSEWRDMPAGSVAILRAYPAPGWRFGGWITQRGTFDPDTFTRPSSILTLKQDRERSVWAMFVLNTESFDLSDADDDGLIAYLEAQLGSSPNDSDTDDDGLPDGWEANYDMSPTNPNTAANDPDDDCSPNSLEFVRGTSPREFGSRLKVYLSKHGEGDIGYSPEKNFYHQGETIELTATPAEGYVFGGWKGDVSDPENETTSAEFASHVAVQARFLARVTVTPEIHGDGSVTLVDRPLGEFIEGEIAHLSAVPDDGWVFDHWLGDIEGNDAEVTAPVTPGFSVTAIFKAIEFPVTIRTNLPGAAVTVNGAGPYYDGSIVHVPADSSVDIAAVESPDYFFKSWDGNLRSQNPAKTITADKVIDVAATFVPARTIVIHGDPANPISANDFEFEQRPKYRGKAFLVSGEQIQSEGQNTISVKGIDQWKWLLDLKYVVPNPAEPFTEWYWFDEEDPYGFSCDLVSRYGDSVTLDLINYPPEEIYIRGWENASISPIIVRAEPRLGGIIRVGQEYEYVPPAGPEGPFFADSAYPNTTLDTAVDVRWDIEPSRAPCSVTARPQVVVADRPQKISFEAIPIIPEQDPGFDPLDFIKWRVGTSPNFGNELETSPHFSKIFYRNRLQTYYVTAIFKKRHWLGVRATKAGLLGDESISEQELDVALTFVPSAARRELDGDMVWGNFIEGTPVTVRIDKDSLQGANKFYEIDTWYSDPVISGVNESHEDEVQVTVNQDIRLRATFRPAAKVEKVRVSARTLSFLRLEDGHGIIPGGRKDNIEDILPPVTSWGEEEIDFAGGVLDWGNPAAKPQNIQAQRQNANPSLTQYPNTFPRSFNICYSDVAREGEVQPFTVDLVPQVDIGQFPGKYYPNAIWELEPDEGGHLDWDPDSLRCELTNLTHGGLYKVRLVLNPEETNEQLKQEGTGLVQVFLPYAGKDIADWLIEEARIITRPGGMADDWDTWMTTQAEENGWTEQHYFFPNPTSVPSGYYEVNQSPADFADNAYLYVSMYFDYFGTGDTNAVRRYTYYGTDARTTDPINTNDQTKNKPYLHPSYATINNVVVSRGRLNTMLWTCFSRARGESLQEILSGAHQYRRFFEHRSDTGGSQQAINLGSALYDAVIESGVTNSQIKQLVLTPGALRQIQDKIPLNPRALEGLYKESIYRLQLHKLLWPYPNAGQVTPSTEDWGEDGSNQDSGGGYIRPDIFRNYSEVSSQFWSAFWEALGL